MARLVGRSGESELDALIGSLMAETDPVDAAMHDPEAALAFVQAGGLTGDVRERIRERAQAAIGFAKWAAHAEDTGAMVTTPRDAAVQARARRDADAASWRRVLEALEP